MIRVTLLGGLGNQMFQYAAAKALAERNRVGLVLDLSGFRTDPLRSFLLDRLHVPEAQAAVQAETGATKPPNYHVRSLWTQRIDRLAARAGLPSLSRSEVGYREPHFHYDPAFEKLGPRTSLFGYFQSERYFGAIGPTLREWFLPREPFSEPAASMLARIERSKRPVSIHVRRGDYLNAGTAEFHGILGEDYYRRALQRLEDAIDGSSDLFVFSDDPSAAESMLHFLPPSRLVHVAGDPRRPWEDMALMAHCRHNIVANSSFSWWGAWLNPAADKIVIAPRAWFAPAALTRQNTQDLYPQGWLVL